MQRRVLSYVHDLIDGDFFLAMMYFSNKIFPGSGGTKRKFL